MGASFIARNIFNVPTHPGLWEGEAGDEAQRAHPPLSPATPSKAPTMVGPSQPTAGRVRAGVVQERGGGTARAHSSVLKGLLLLQEEAANGEDKAEVR